MAPDVVRILLLEDQDDDARLVERELRRTGLAFELHRAVNRPSFVRALREADPDLILSDNNLPGFSGMDALALAADARSRTPFIFVSGTIGEEAAIEALRRGATDYVIKDRLSRLVPVVERALQESAERRQREQLEREFLQAQKMESLGRMAGSIAHDFNNLLMIILGSVDAVADGPADGAELARAAERVRLAATRGRDLTTRLLAFSRGQAAETTLFELNARLREFGPVFGSLLGRGIQLDVAYSPEALPLRGQPGQIDQVIMNLLVNAKDAMPDGGTVSLATRRVAFDREPPPDFPLLPPGSYAVLSVRDTGTGMTPDIQARLFEPFFTTKQPGQGTGLGLSTVYAIVRQFGGAIAVESASGRGTEFRLVLPLQAERDDPAGRAVDGARRAALLVDDEPGIRDYARRILEMSGYRVVEAGSAADAWNAFAADPAAFGVLVTDVNLPDTDGVELARRVRGARAELPVAFISGVPEQLTRAVEAIAGAHAVAKPFSPGELMRRVGQIRSG